MNNGDIVQTGNEAHRACFIETENLDPIYASISDTIGLSIDYMVIDIARKGNGDYVRAITPPSIIDMLDDGTLQPEKLIEVMLTVGHLSGYGKYEMVEYRFQRDQDDYITFRLTKPYSVLLACGSVLGSFEVVLGQPSAYEYKETAPGVYEITVRIGERNEELDKRLQIGEYRHRDGDIELEICPVCAAPLALREFKWDVGQGIIANSRTGRRMALVGPYVLDPMFGELEKELGKDIMTMTVEAQRRFTRSGLYSIEEISDQGDFRTQLALRGLGNLREIKINNKGLQMRIDNAADYLITTGIAQGLFETGFGVDSSVDWEVSDEGVLQVEVIPIEMI